VKTSDIWNKEQAFHDRWAESVDVAKLPVDVTFTGPAALENRWLLQQLGDVRGKKLLDVGAGLGESAVYFAKLGAEVTATDISPAMADFTHRLAAHHGVKVRTHIGPAETLAFPAESFDIVHLANTLHHVTDKRALLTRLRAILKPGGTYCSWDPVKYNPVINVYRRLAQAVRTDDEAPLGLVELRLVREYFPGAKVHFFWISTLTLFLKYYLVERKDPGRHRYWKMIYLETPASLWWWRPLARLDDFLTRLPGLRWLAWNMALVGQKPLDPARAIFS